MQSSLVTCSVGGSNYSPEGPSGVLLCGSFQEHDIHATASISVTLIIWIRQEDWEEDNMGLSLPVGPALL